jgi:integrase
MTLRRRFERINRGVADPTARPALGASVRRGASARTSAEGPAHRADFLGVTRRVNGGTNGLADRFACLHAVARLLQLPRGEDDALVFGRAAELPFATNTVHTRARLAWKAAGMTPIGLHEGRHTFASTLIAAGANPKVIQVAMGHKHISETFDTYDALFPGGLGEAAEAANAWLARAGVR